MIKAIIFDFDGVIVASEHIKTDAFRELFLQYPSQLEQIVEYHVNSMGVSRYKKFEYIYDNFLKLEYNKGIEKHLGDRFSEIVVNKIIQSTFIKGAKEFIEQNQNKYKMFICTGTPQNEIDIIAKEKKINQYFEEIFGYPQTKDVVVNSILNRYGLLPNEVAFVGDAMVDYNAAMKTGIWFVGKVYDLERSMFPDGTILTVDFIKFGNILDKFL